MIGSEAVKNIFKRDKNSYKNDFGHILVIASSYNMPGAGVLCANAAITSGAGLVTFAFPETAYASVSGNVKPEIMLLPLEEKNGRIKKSAKIKILDFIEKRKIASVAIGCGIGQEQKDFFSNLIFTIIKNFDIYVTIDADAINSLKGIETNTVIKEFKNSKSKIIITPHPKEFERISGIEYKNDEKFRKKITETFAKNNGIICVLKGHKTIVSDGKKVYINSTGNPGMATAGSGDVLTGIIAAFVCNKNKDLLQNVSIAVYVHGLAGDFAGKEKTQVSMTASDIIDNIYKAVKKIVKSNF